MVEKYNPDGNDREIKVSVIVPVYNREKQLKRSVQSLLAQALKEMEILLVDDGSTDHTLQVCKELAEKDARIRVIHKENGGPGSARNAGIAESRGEYIAFMDSDDEYEPDIFENMYKKAAEHNLDILRANLRIIQEGREERSWIPPFAEEILDEGRIKGELMPLIIAPEAEGSYNNLLQKGCYACLYRREFLQKYDIKFCDLKCGEDYVFVMTASWYAKRIMQVRDYVYIYYRQVTNSLSVGDDRIQSYKDRLRAKEMVMKLAEGLPYAKEYEKRYEQSKRRYVFLDIRLVTLHNPKANKKEKCALIRKIVNSPEAVEAYRLPVQGKLPFQMKVLYHFIKYKHTHALYWLIWLKYGRV